MSDTVCFNLTTGYLRIAVLKELSIKECSGYDLMKNLELRTGRKPSPGSVYPLLKDLQKNKLIQETTFGRRKVYSLTVKGKNKIQSLQKERKELMLRCVQTHGQFCDNLPKKKIINILESKEDLLFSNADLMIKLKKEIFNQLITNEKNVKVIRKILKHAIEEVKQCR